LTWNNALKKKGGAVKKGWVKGGGVIGNFVPCNVSGKPASLYVFTIEDFGAQDLHASLEQQAERARQQATELREKLSYLWERLQIPGEHRAHFLDTHHGYTFSTIEAVSTAAFRYNTGMSQVRKNGFKISKNSYFDLNIFKTVLWGHLQRTSALEGEGGVWPMRTLVEGGASLPLRTSYFKPSFKPKVIFLQISFHFPKTINLFP